MMKQLEITLPIKPHENQHGLLHSKTRYNVIAAGRRFGKTEVCKLRAIFKVLDGKYIWWLNPTWKSGTDTWRDFLNVFVNVPGAEINKSERRIILPNGGHLLMMAADSFKRGAGVNHMFVDEAAFQPHTLWGYELRPMLLESKGGADFLSSTNGRNWFWALFQLGVDPEETEWKSWHFTSYDNPLLDEDEIESIRRNTPERVFSQEYMAEFLDDGGAVFRNLNACIQDMPETYTDVVMGCDLGRHHDYTVIYAMDTKTQKIIGYDRFTDISWDIQAGRIITLAQKFKARLIVIEENFNDSFVERLQMAGLPVTPYRTTSQGKQQIINQLALAFEQEDIGIPNDPVLLGELQAYTMERLPGGTFRYNAPSGLHDDCVMALALTWYAMGANQWRVA